MEFLNFLNTATDINQSAIFAKPTTPDYSSKSDMTTRTPTSFEQHLKKSIEPTVVAQKKLPVDEPVKDNQLEILADDVLKGIKDIVDEKSDKLNSDDLEESVNEFIDTLNLASEDAQELKNSILELINGEITSGKEELAELLAFMDNIDLAADNTEDVKALLSDIEENIEINGFGESKAEVLVMLQKLDSSNINDEEVLSQIESIQKLLSSQDTMLNKSNAALAAALEEMKAANGDTSLTKISGEEFEGMLETDQVKEKVMGMLAPLSKEQQFALAKELQQQNGDSAESAPTLENDLLASIEKSNELVVTNAPKVETGPLSVETTLTQLESSFKNPIQTNETLGSNVRMDQQGIKDLNNIQTTALKTAELTPAKLTLNDSVIASQQLKEHLILMSKGGVNQAFMQLDPEELGAMSVRVVMQNEQMSVQFQVQNSQAKDMLEQAMNRLKESLQEQGIQLSQSDVEQQNQQGGQSESSANSLNGNTTIDFDEDDSEVMVMTLDKHSSNGIDYYA